MCFIINRSYYLPIYLNDQNLGGGGGGGGGGMPTDSYVELPLSTFQYFLCNAITKIDVLVKFVVRTKY